MRGRHVSRCQKTARSYACRWPDCGWLAMAFIHARCATGQAWRTKQGVGIGNLPALLYEFADPCVLKKWTCAISWRRPHDQEQAGPPPATGLFGRAPCVQRKCRGGAGSLGPLLDRRRSATTTRPLQDGVQSTADVTPVYTRMNSLPLFIPTNPLNVALTLSHDFSLRMLPSQRCTLG